MCSWGCVSDYASKFACFKKLNDMQLALFVLTVWSFHQSFPKLVFFVCVRFSTENVSRNKRLSTSKVDCTCNFASWGSSLSLSAACNATEIY